MEANVGPGPEIYNVDAVELHVKGKSAAGVTFLSILCTGFRS
jgi:hypothetical protein